MLPAPINTTLKSSAPPTCVVLIIGLNSTDQRRSDKNYYLSIGMSLDGSMEARLEPPVAEPLRSDGRLADGLRLAKPAAVGELCMVVV
jgi:hypothetical protein